MSTPAWSKAKASSRVAARFGSPGADIDDKTLPAGAFEPRKAFLNAIHVRQSFRFEDSSFKLGMSAKSTKKTEGEWICIFLRRLRALRAK